jgi:hypothetical protein
MDFCILSLTLMPLRLPKNYSFMLTSVLKNVSTMQGLYMKNAMMKLFGLSLHAGEFHFLWTKFFFSNLAVKSRRKTPCQTCVTKKFVTKNTVSNLCDQKICDEKHRVKLVWPKNLWPSVRIPTGYACDIYSARYTSMLKVADNRSYNL